jgi:membrane-bound lytic murein transglycosylase D
MKNNQARCRALTAIALACGVLGASAWAQEADSPFTAAPPKPAALAATAPAATLPPSTPPAAATPPVVQPAASAAQGGLASVPSGQPAAPEAAASAPAGSQAQPGSPTPADNRAVSPATVPPADTVRPASAPPEPPAAAASREASLVGTEMAPPVEQVVDAPALQEDLWGRVRRLYAVPDLDTDLVRKWETYYTQRPDYLQRMFERGGRYLFHIVEEVSRRGMPSEVALLPFIESAFNPQAMSSARASGMWQFMPATGKSFDLHQNIFRDDRRSVLDSTRAALDYLQRLHGRFGDWHLALAAYNWGQGNVSRAIAENRRLGRGARYAELVMPDETRNYVPKLQAIANLVQRPEQFGLQLPPLLNHPYFLTVTVDRDIDVALAVRLAGLSLEEFQALNPQMNKPVILAAGTTQLLLPFDNARQYQRDVAKHRGPFASWTAWVAPRTLKPIEAAKAVGMSEERLREVNRIPPRMLVKAGSTLLVPRSAQMQRDVSEHVADTAMISLAPEVMPGRKRVVRAGAKGESVAALAQRYRVPAAQVASWNDVSANGSFRAGQNVVLYLAPTKPQARGRAVAAAVRKAPTKARVATRPQARPAAVRVAKR